jgi:hypothetical protein
MTGRTRRSVRVRTTWTKGLVKGWTHLSEQVRRAHATFHRSSSLSGRDRRYGHPLSEAHSSKQCCQDRNIDEQLQKGLRSARVSNTNTPPDTIVQNTLWSVHINRRRTRLDKVATSMRCHFPEAAALLGRSTPHTTHDHACARDDRKHGVAAWTNGS